MSIHTNTKSWHLLNVVTWPLAQNVHMNHEGMPVSHVTLCHPVQPSAWDYKWILEKSMPVNPFFTDFLQVFKTCHLTFDIWEVGRVLRGFGSIETFLDVLGHYETFCWVSVCFGTFWDALWCFWTCCDIFGRFRMFWDVFGNFYKSWYVLVGFGSFF